MQWKAPFIKTGLWVTKKHPRAAKCILWAWAKPSILLRREPRELFFQMANALNYRIHTVTSLWNGMKIKVVWNDLLGLEIFKNGCHDRQNVDILSSLLIAGAVFLDIGANIGQYTLIGSRIVGEEGEVHCFEPDPETFRCLVDNIEMNGLKNVSASQVALSNEEGARTFYLSWPQYMGGNSFRSSSSPESWPGRVCEVKCYTLDSYVRKRSVRHIDVIKIDVEGAEVEVLKGAETILRAENKPAILFESNGPALKRLGHSPAELTQLLIDWGYEVFQVTEDGRLAALGGNLRSDEVRDFVALPAHLALIKNYPLPDAKENQASSLD